MLNFSPLTSQYSPHGKCRQDDERVQCLPHFLSSLWGTVWNKSWKYGYDITKTYRNIHCLNYSLQKQRPIAHEEMINSYWQDWNLMWTRARLFTKCCNDQNKLGCPKASVCPHWATIADKGGAFKISKVYPWNLLPIPVAAGNSIGKKEGRGDQRLSPFVEIYSMLGKRVITKIEEMRSVLPYCEAVLNPTLSQVKVCSFYGWGSWGTKSIAPDTHLNYSIQWESCRRGQERGLIVGRKGNNRYDGITLFVLLERKLEFFSMAYSVMTAETVNEISQHKNT